VWSRVYHSYHLFPRKKEAQIEARGKETESDRIGIEQHRGRDVCMFELDPSHGDELADRYKELWDPKDQEHRNVAARWFKPSSFSGNLKANDIRTYISGLELDTDLPIGTLALH
jgi:hypothetical protein